MPLIFPSDDIDQSLSVPVVFNTSSTVPAIKYGEKSIPAPPNFHSELGPLKLEEQGPIVSADYQRPLFNDFGFVVRGKSDEGDDIMLWTFMYRQHGPEIVISNDVTQTAFIATKLSDAEKVHMHDLPFINKGQNIEDYFTLGSLEFENKPDKVSWKIAGRELGYTGKTWFAKGIHAGVDLDLTMEQRGDFFYHVAPYEKFDFDTQTGLAGGNGHVRVSGTIKANDKTYTLTNVHGVFERIIMAGSVPERINYMGKGGSPWMHSWGEQLSFFTISRDTGANAQFSINVDGQTHAVIGNGWTITREREQWLDPKTKQANPRKWSVHATTEVGRLEATVTGFARWYYTWVRRHGVLLVHNFICDTTMTFTRNDGTVIHEKGVGCVEYMRTLYNQSQTQQIETL